MQFVNFESGMNVHSSANANLPGAAKGGLTCELLSIPADSMYNRPSGNQGERPCKFSIELDNSDGNAGILFFMLKSKLPWKTKELKVAELNAFFNQEKFHYLFDDVSVESIQEGLLGSKKVVHLDCRCKTFELQKASGGRIDVREAQTIIKHDRDFGHMFLLKERIQAIRAGGIVNKQKGKAYIVFATSGGGGFVVSGENGVIFAVDPDTADVYSYKYFGLGGGVGISGGVSFQVGVAHMENPKDMAGFGFEVSVFAAAGPAGASAQVSGNSIFGNGEIETGAGYSAGGGASATMLLTHTSYSGETKLQALSKEALEALSKYTQAKGNTALNSKIKDALKNKGRST